MRIAPPSPSWIDDGSSPMIAPTTLAVAAIFSAVKMYGSDVGHAQLPEHRASGSAAYECISSSARGSAECRPRSVLIATGKNVR